VRRILKHQPDRESGSWRGWLYRTAQHEAWRLNALEWKERSVADSSGEPLEPPDLRDRYEERLEFQAALQELRKLPPQLQQAVLIRSQVCMSPRFCVLKARSVLDLVDRAGDPERLKADDSRDDGGEDSHARGAHAAAFGTSV
jgi:hypothetical protein